MQAQARAIGPRRGPRFQAQVPAGPRVSAEINQRVRCAKNSSQIQLSATTRPCRPSRASKDPQRHAIEQMPRRGREGRRRHIGGGPGVGPGGRVRRSRSTSLTLVVVVARILGRVERDWPRRAEFVGTRAGGETAESHMAVGPAYGMVRDRVTEALDVSRGRGALRVLAADRGLCSANCKIRPSRPGAQFFSIRRRSTRRSSGTTETVFQIHDAVWRQVEAARAACEAFHGNRGLPRSPSRAVLPSAGPSARACVGDVVRRPPGRFSFDETAYVGNRIG